MAYKKKSPAKNIFNLTKSSAEANRRANAATMTPLSPSRPADFTKGEYTSSETANKVVKEGASRPAYERPGTGSTKVDKPKTAVKPKTTAKTKLNTSTKSKPVIKTKPAAKPIKSSGSDKGTGYFNDKLSLGVDTKLNVAPMPKFERTVTNARSADYDLVRAKGRGRTSRLKSRLARRQGRVENRVDRSLARIDARQQRAGTKYAGKMQAAQIKSDKGKTDPGYFDSQKKLDAVGIRGSESPKATNTTGQKAAQGSMKLKPTMSKTQTLTDAQLNKKLNKPAVKKKNTGKTKSLSMTRGESQKSLTDLAMTGK